MAEYASESHSRMPLTLITCTGGRQEAFALCERWIVRQTFNGDVQWLVVDDCDPATTLTMGQELIRPTVRWKPGQNTLGRNLLAALPLAVFDKILFIEDDDYYPPEYLAAMAKLLDSYPIAGEAPARYYNVSTRQFKQLHNGHHASLCQTGIRRELVPSLMRIACREQKFIDIPLWRDHGRTGPLMPSTAVGMKGMPGRAGIGMGHRPNAGWSDDQKMQTLCAWIGDDAEAYAQFMEQKAA
jgi:glycosyltransferase involved in cell wall biosynthesis